MLVTIHSNFITKESTMSRKYMFCNTTVKKSSCHYYCHHRHVRHYHRHRNPVHYHNTCVTTNSRHAQRSQSTNDARPLQSTDFSCRNQRGNLTVSFLISVPAVALIWITVCSLLGMEPIRARTTGWWKTHGGKAGEWRVTLWWAGTNTTSVESPQMQAILLFKSP